MNLLDTLKNPPVAKNVQVHKVTRVLGMVTAAEREGLEIALAKPEVWSAEKLAKVITELVHPVSASSVKRYRINVLGITQ